MSEQTPKFSRTVEFKAGRVELHEDGTATFHFRNMEYVYLPGRDTDDGMRITLDEDTANAIKRLFRNAGEY